MAYRFYIADGLRILTENTARISGGSYLTLRYAEIINPSLQDNRTGAEIAADVIKRAGIEVIE